MTSKKPDPANAPTNRPLIDPLTDSLAAFSDEDRAAAMERFRVLQPHIETGVPLTGVADTSGHPIRTLRRWAARYHEAGLSGLVRRQRSDAGRRKLHADLAQQIEALALQKPRLSAALIHRRIAEAAKAEGHPAPSHATVRRVMGALDPAMLCLVHEGPTAYRDRYELIHRHRAERPNAVWQTDHTQLDLLILDANSKPARPWLTIVQDDYSRAVAGYCVFLGAPSALQTALALRQAIWRKTDPDWPVCGIPETLYTDHGSDFTSQHLEQVAAELRIELVFSAVARPQGRGKIERIFGTVNTELLPELPGYLAEGKTRRPPALSLSELGCVDEVPEPHADRGDLDEAQKAGGGLVVAGGDAPGVLEAIEASLDAVAQGVDVGVDALTHLAVPAGGDDCDAAPVLHVLADRVGVVAAVGEQHPGERSVGLHQRTVAAIIGNLAAGDLDGDGQPRAVRLEMDLGREATS